MLVLWFKDIVIKDVPRVGGKNASLGEMYRKLNSKGVRIPNGFATTSEAYWDFLKQAGLKPKIKAILDNLDIANIKQLGIKGKEIRELILSAQLPLKLEDEIVSFYKKLSAQYNTQAVDVAVRSSATAEDMPSASFAGQMDTHLNIKGKKQLLEAVQKCMASLFTDRAIVYRQTKGFDHLKVAISIGIQKMVRSDISCSGVMFSCDTESGFADVTVINSSWGLGENIVQGKVSPDEFMVYEPNLDKFKPIISKKIGSKEWKMIYSTVKGKSVKNVRPTLKEKQSFTLTDDEILELAKYSVIIEKHYRRAMDMEWAKDGHDKKLYILQARPETVQSQKSIDVLTEYIFVNKKTRQVFPGQRKYKDMESQFTPIVSGTAIGSKIGAGQANVIKSVKDISKFKPGQILITQMTDPDWVPIMKQAQAIVTNSGGRTCHASIISRELGIPCIVGTRNATKKIKPNQAITVSCAEGETGYVYKGIKEYKIKQTKIKNFKKPNTKIMMNLAEPEQAFALSFIPNDGVGLAREEFIINNYIKIHPLALLNYSKLTSQTVKKQIDKVTAGYPSKPQFYVDKLAEGIGKIAAAFYPKEVIVRFSDFKTNEYANLIGGKEFEPQETNPMIGWRGASRYYSPEFKKAFDLECLAIKKVRQVMGLDNVIVMVPFCRTIEEGKKVLAIIDKHGLRKKQTKLKPLQVYVMAEIPSNVILGDEFAKIFDGFSIGTNDLTQLTLGLDRDSGLVSHLFDERNKAVKRIVTQMITTAHKYNRKIGICGQGPSDFPEFAEFLVEQGIDSISLTPDTVVKTSLQVLKKEKKLKK
ncbi:phosphoenolpyruvate synthase [Patescibacteria group bacterium]|nr:phosphoenolpyruvate synthase [Patescibacteria group bacterium]